MKTPKYIIAFLALLILPFHGMTQCSTATTICSQGTAGPFGFNAPSPTSSTCLDFYGPGYAYIVLYITQSGPLQMLIEGNASGGFLDVAIFNVPAGIDPCVAIQNMANQISCNYASNSSGCNQIGNYFSCPSTVSSPMVSAGDKLMIVVENWSGASTDFTLQMAPSPAAQSGPGNATINPPSSTVYTSTSPFQMTAVDNGGAWSGPGVTSSGVFDPSINGSGTYTITHVLGTPPCDATATYQLTVEPVLAVEMKSVEVSCKNEDEVEVIWETEVQTNCHYFSVERSRDGFDFEVVDEVDGHGTNNEPLKYVSTVWSDPAYAYYRLVEVDFNGSKTPFGPYFVDCGKDEFKVYPNPTNQLLHVELTGFQLDQSTITLYDNRGTVVLTEQANISGEQELSLNRIDPGVYIILVEDLQHKKMEKVIKM